MQETIIIKTGHITRQSTWFYYYLLDSRLSCYKLKLACQLERYEETLCSLPKKSVTEEKNLASFILKNVKFKDSNEGGNDHLLLSNKIFQNYFN